MISPFPKHSQDRKNATEGGHHGTHDLPVNIYSKKRQLAKQRNAAVPGRLTQRPPQTGTSLLTLPFPHNPFYKCTH